MSIWSEILSTVKHLFHKVCLCHAAPKGMGGGKEGCPEKSHLQLFWEVSSPSGVWACEELACVCLVLLHGQESWDVWVSSLAPRTSWWNSDVSFQGPQVVSAESCLERSLVALTEDLASGSLILDLKVFTSVLFIRSRSSYGGKTEDKQEIKREKKHL